MEPALARSMTAAMQRRIVACAVGCIGFVFCPSAGAYSVLAHEALVDALWTDSIAPLLHQKFPGLTNEQIKEARAAR